MSAPDAPSTTTTAPTQPPAGQAAPRFAPAAPAQAWAAIVDEAGYDADDEKEEDGDLKRDPDDNEGPQKAKRVLRSSGTGR
ncbi:hypothetical protein CONLIGDRAFT_684945 [Coniochaeta ligniaria NRRL 30616]|uniref:Uncharacterized protein n=1 Tax=Coniochaeta ligniaria NRRL 30616 TaxID=1408157 RepID=A0A1J7J5J6_9PEZI|nr:hypothetical protein CONLIGDRAFT_684945 [Coniochaeta ligniaria NRRL 30616]